MKVVIFVNINIRIRFSELVSAQQVYADAKVQDKNARNPLHF
jgi:hypothetical protein